MQNITINLIEQNVLYEILIESIDNLNFKINSYNNIIDLNNNLDKTKANVIIADIKNYEIFLKKKINTPILYLDSSPKKNKEFLLNSIKCPFKLKDFIEKVNVVFLKSKFLDNSQYSILDYNINLNSKEITKNNISLKLTEKEINFILFLKKKNSPQNVNSILQSVWGYSLNLETHTVETHVHRLRKKFIDAFDDNHFIKINKKGYYI
jgi:hypothetical protein